jgi:RNA polymerase sigma factor (sigma-70 family)
VNDTLSEFVDRVDSAPSASDDALRAELIGVIRAEINALNEKQRSLIDRFYAEGQSIAEIAADVGETESAIESQLVRIRVKLRNKLQPRLSSMGYHIKATKVSREKRRDSN